MAAIGILDELRFAQRPFVLGKKIMDLLRTADKDVGSRSKIEPHNVSELLGQRLQEAEDVGLTELGVQSAELLALGPGWRYRHQLPAAGDLAGSP
jgi:hypothetical protein